MSNWLTPIAKGLGVGGLLGLSSRELREVITEGADMIMKNRRTDLIPQFIRGVPEGAAIINDEHSLEIFLAGIISAAVKMGAWQNTRFAYEAKAFSRIYYTRPWRDFAAGLARHDHHPIVLAEQEVYVFGGRDWHVGQVKIAIGPA